MKFTIRDLLCLTVVVALFLGWALDRFVLVEKLHRLEKLLDSAWPGWRTPNFPAPAPNPPKP